MQSLRRCLDPRSIAVVGGKEAGRVLEQCRKFGFGGRLYAVNPARRSIEGIKSVPKVVDLPEPPDVAFVAVPAEPSIDIIGQLAAMGAGGVVCYASGFSETGHGNRHQRLLEAAGEMPVIGPNCYGYLNAATGAALWPDQHGLKRLPDYLNHQNGGGIAIFSSSGNVSINISMQQRSLPITLLLTVGNQAVVGMEECLEAALDDPRITAIGLHIEGLRSLDRFAVLADRAYREGKTIVALKTGRTESGARITLSHTATLAGSAAVYDALMARLGIAVVDDIEVFLEALKLAAVHGQHLGPSISSMSCSGGEASLIADLVEDTPLRFLPLECAHADEVRATLNEFVVIDNPLDYHTFIWGDVERLQSTFRAMLNGGFDLTLLILDYPVVNDCDMSEWVDAGNAFVRACHDAGRPGAVVSLMSENLPAEVRETLLSQGVAPMQGLRQAVAAIAALVAAIASRGSLPHIEARDLLSESAAVRSLSEHEAKQLFTVAGISVPDSALANDVERAVASAEQIGYPVVLKASSPSMQHKTESGGVVVNLDGADAVRTSAARLLDLTGQVLVEKMLSPAVVELLLGVVTDPQMGQYLVVGSGGVLTELLSDRKILLLPATDAEIREALGQLRCAPLLYGYRGSAGADVDAVVRAVRGLIDFVTTRKDSMIEAEINPLMVGSPGEGAVAADAMVVLRADA